MSDEDDSGPTPPVPDLSDLAGEPGDISVDTFEDRLAEIEAGLEGAQTEAELDEIDAALTLTTDMLEQTEFDETEAGDDEDDEDPAAGIQDRLDEIEATVEEKRGPYAEDIVDDLDGIRNDLTAAELTADGRQAIAAAIADYLSTVAEVIESVSSPEEPLSDDTPVEDLSAALEQIGTAIDSADLDPDGDAATISMLSEATATLGDAMDDAEVVDDLTVREQLEYEGFYDVLSPENRRDFPPEWNAIKLYEAKGEVEPILRAFEMMDSDFMEENILDALEHLAPPEAYDQLEELAQRRNVRAIRILGRIGDERACDMLEGFLGGGDVTLQTTSLWALGCIGSRDSTEAVAQELVADNPDIRSAAARSLGRIGDTRAIDPLADVLSDDETEQVRASAAWALYQINTPQAHDILAAYTDDRSYLVQSAARDGIA